MTGSTNNLLILASGSPRRAQILAEAGIEPEVVPADVDEDDAFLGSSSLIESVESLALRKARAVAETQSSRFVLGADTIVVLDGEVLGKPASETQATEMLNRLSDREHDVITGIAVINPAGETHTKHVSTRVKFRNLDDEEIAEYVYSGSPMDKAGGYGIQDQSFSPVASYDECYLNVVGLPMCATSELLEISGFVASSTISCAGHNAPAPNPRMSQQ